MPTPLHELPADQYGQVMQMTPKSVALARTVNAAISVSTKIALNANTTFLRVYAISQDVYLKWANTDTDYVAADNFDEVIPSGQIVDLAVPNKADGTPFTNIMVLERVSGATVIVIEK